MTSHLNKLMGLAFALSAWIATPAQAYPGDLEVKVDKTTLDSGQTQYRAILTFEGYLVGEISNLIEEKARPVKWYNPDIVGDDIACDSTEYPPAERGLRCSTVLQVNGDNYPNTPGIAEWLLGPERMKVNAQALAEPADDRLKIMITGKGAKKLYKLARKWTENDAPVRCSRKRHHLVLHHYTCTMFIDDEGRFSAD